MRPIHLIRTNYADSDIAIGLRDLLGNPFIQWTHEETEVNLSMIEKDLPRQIFISDVKTYEEICADWKETAKLKSYGFTQGDFTGGAIVELFLTIMLPLQLQEKVDYIVANRISSLSFCYVTDEGNYASIRIGYNLEDPTQWIVTIMENLTAPFEERPYSIYLHNLDFGTEETALWSTLEDIHRTLKSKSTSELIARIINPRSCSINLTFATALSNDTQTRLKAPNETITKTKTCMRPQDIIAEFNEQQYGQVQAPDRLLSASKYRTTAAAADSVSTETMLSS